MIVRILRDYNSLSDGGIHWLKDDEMRGTCMLVGNNFPGLEFAVDEMSEGYTQKIIS